MCRAGDWEQCGVLWLLHADKWTAKQAGNYVSEKAFASVFGVGISVQVSGYSKRIFLFVCNSST